MNQDYNNYGGQQPDNGAPQYIPPHPMMQPPEQKKTGPAVAAFCMSFANLVVFKSVLSFILVPIALVLAIISLKRHYGCKPLSIIAICASVISTFIFGFYIVLAVKLYPEVKYFVDNESSIVSEYEETGYAPEHYDKFRGKDFDFVWSNLGVKDFDEFFDIFMKAYTQKETPAKKKSPTSKVPESSTKDPDEPSSEESATTFKDYDHSGEDLVILS